MLVPSYSAENSTPGTSSTPTSRAASAASSDPRGRVVVGERDHVQTELGRSAHHLGRREGAVGLVGVGVEIDAGHAARHRVTAPAPASRARDERRGDLGHRADPRQCHGVVELVAQDPQHLRDAFLAACSQAPHRRTPDEHGRSTEREAFNVGPPPDPPSIASAPVRRPPRRPRAEPSRPPRHRRAAVRRVRDHDAVHAVIEAIAASSAVMMPFTQQGQPGARSRIHPMSAQERRDRRQGRRRGDRAASGTRCACRGGGARSREIDREAHRAVAGGNHPLQHVGGHPRSVNRYSCHHFGPLEAAATSSR